MRTGDWRRGRTADAQFVDQVGTFRTLLLIGMAIMGDLGMATGRRACTREPTNRGFTPTRNRRLDTRPSTVARQLLKTSLETSPARPAMTQHRARMKTTFQLLSTDAGTNMFWFEVIFGGGSHAGTLLGGDAFGGFRLAGATFLAALVAAAVEVYAASADALRGFDNVALVAEGAGGRFAAAAENVDVNETGSAFIGVAGLCTFVAALERLFAKLVASRNRSFAIGARGIEDF